MWVIGMLFEDLDERCHFFVPRWARIGWRVPVGVAVIMITFAEMDVTLLMGMVTLMTGFLVFWELIMQTPRDDWFRFNLESP